MIEKILERLREVGQLEIYFHGGRCNGKTLTLGYKKGIENAISIVQEVAKGYGKDTNVRSNEKKLYHIDLNGCDDSTIFEMELSEQEYEFLSRVSELANKTSTYQCMPRLYVEQKGE